MPTFSQGKIPDVIPSMTETQSEQATHRFHRSVPKSSIFVALALTIAAVFFTWKAPASRDPGETVALVDGEIITSGQFQLAWSKAQLEDTPESRREVLDNLIQRSALVGQARDLGLDRDPEFLADVQRLLIARLKTVRLDEQLGQLELSDQSLRDYYDQIKATRFTRAEKRKLAVLWFNSRGQVQLEDRYKQKLETVLTRLEKLDIPVEQGFGNLSLTNTEHRPSRFKGGIVGWLDARQGSDPWKARIWEIATLLKKPGDLSPVIACDEGVFIVRLLETAPSRTLPFEEVQAEIRREKRSEMARTLEKAFRDKALEEAEIEIFEDTLGGLDLPKQQKPQPNRDQSLASAPTLSN